MGLGENLKERNESQICRQSTMNSRGCSGSISGAEEGVGDETKSGNRECIVGMREQVVKNSLGSLGFLYG